MNFTKKLIGFCLVSVLVLIIANSIAPDAIVFGNFVTSPLQAVFATGIIIGVIASLVDIVFDDLTLKLDSNKEFISYFLVNCATTYAIARTFISKMIGFGIVGFWVAIVLGGLLTAAHMAYLRAMKRKW